MMIRNTSCQTRGFSLGKGPHASRFACRDSKTPCRRWAILVVMVTVASSLLEINLVQADSYDLRDYNRVTPVKDQNPYGNCWAYATMCSIESNMLTQGFASDPNSPSVDYSESHLSRFYDGYDVGQPITGGSRHEALSYFSRGRGPVLESQYPKPGTTGDLYANHAYAPQCWVTAQQWIDRENVYHPATFQDIKNTIVAHGAIETNMLWDDYYYNAGYNSYYCPGGPYTINHAVSLVGWDDAKMTHSGNPGAWLVKNSWDTWFGDDGYFWLSYDDMSAVRSATSYQVAPAATYNEVIENQTNAPNTWWNIQYGASKFTTDGAGFLEAVGFATDEYGIQYSISVYDSWSGNQPSGLLRTEMGSYDWPGYYVVDFDSPILMEANDDFVVVLHLSGGTGAGYYLAADTTCGDPMDVNYISNDGMYWYDMSSMLGGDNILFLKTFVSNIPGDANRDGAVDEADSAALAANWGESDATWAMGDFDCDGVVGPRDASILGANWGYNASEALAVPEPSVFILMLGALVACGTLRSRSDR
ncbi:MAG: hypothetical protein JW888_01980 [Pirellulales bacterium]|nr:hypothetical protein [Pirellulales bacterium]